MLGSTAIKTLARAILPAAVLCINALSDCTIPARAAEEATTSREAQRTTFTQAEIIDGFIKIAFGAEFQADQRVDRIRKYDQPVRVFVDSRGEPDRRAQIAAVVVDIRTRIKGLDIAITPTRVDANMIVTLVRDRDLERTIRSIYGTARARNIERSLRPQCLAGFAKDETYRILRSEVLLVVDEGDFTFYDCAYEEILQALGPINDDRSVPWSMFNDDVSMGYFDVYDQILLNLLYDPQIHPGMTKEEALHLLPQILPGVLEFVAHNEPPH